MAINIPIISSLNSKGFDSAKKEFSSLQGVGAKSAFLLQKAMLPAAGAVSALAGGLVIAAKAAIEDEQSTKKLETQLRATLGPNQALVDSIGDFIDKTQLATGVADDQLRPALAGLVRFTGNATKAQELLTLSIDASVATGKDLTAVSTAIGKAYDGNFTALRKLGVPLDENIIKTKDFEAAQKALTAQFGGAAAANSLTYAGRLQILKIRFDEMVESIGYRVLPVLDRLLNETDGLIRIMDERGLGGVLNEVGSRLRRLVDPATALTDALNKNVKANDGVIDKFKQQGINAVNLGSKIANLAGGIIGLRVNFGELESGVDEANRKVREAFTLTKNYSDVVLQLDQDQKRAAYQKAVDLEQTRLANAEMAKSVASTKKATDAAARAAAATAAHAESVRNLKEAYDSAVETVRDRFSPALAKANEQLTNATNDYNTFYNATADVVRGIFNIAGAWNQAADSDGAENFFGVLDDQVSKALELGDGIRQLIEAGLDDPALLNQILAAGGDVGLDIINGILAGGEASISKLVGLSQQVGDAAARIAQLTADKWYKSGIDQAQNIVNGVNSVIDNTEFLLRFAIDPQSVAAIGAAFDQNVNTIQAGGQVATPSNPFAGFVLGSINPESNLGGSVSTSSVNINVNGGDPNAVVDALRRYMVTNGTVPIRVGG
jgi:hypothetical protein